jgi:hypothetical protein
VLASSITHKLSTGAAHNKDYQNLKDDKFFKNLIDYKTSLAIKDIPCDDNGTHFNNGRFDLNTGTFAYLSESQLL